jgi:hypothetical protein
MIYQHAQANPTDDEVSLNSTDGSEDSKVADGPGDETIVNAEWRDETGDESLTTVRAHY